jgi:hypothetical protein
MRGDHNPLGLYHSTHYLIEEESLKNAKVGRVRIMKKQQAKAKTMEGEKREIRN